MVLIFFAGCRNAIRHFPDSLFFYLSVFTLISVNVVAFLFDASYPRISSILIRISSILILILVLVFFHHFLKTKISPFLFLSIGAFCNGLVCVLNNGKMPVSTNYLDIFPLELIDSSTRHQLINSSTRLEFLGDILYFPYAGSIFSIGDVFVLFGLFLFVLPVKTPDS